MRSQPALKDYSFDVGPVVVEIVERRRGVFRWHWYATLQGRYGRSISGLSRSEQGAKDAARDAARRILDNGAGRSLVGGAR